MNKVGLFVFGVPGLDKHLNAFAGLPQCPVSKFLLKALIVCLTFFNIVGVSTEIPRTVTFQGAYIQDGKRSDQVAPVNILVEFLAADQSVIYSEIHSQVPLNHGFFNIWLGLGQDPETSDARQGLPIGVDAASAMRLTIDESEPVDLKLSSGFFAFKAVSAERLVIPGSETEVVTLMEEGGVSKVGIGTTTPQTKLDVAGVITAEGGDSTLWNQGVSLASVAHGWGNHADVGYLISFTESDPKVTGLGTGYLPFWNGQKLANSVMFFNNGVNVGISKTSPSTKLDVNGVITATGGNSTEWNQAYDWGNHASAGYARTGSFLNDLNSGVYQYAYWNGSEIRGGGLMQSGTYVGIGNDSAGPQSKLHVHASASHLKDAVHNTHILLTSEGVSPKTSELCELYVT